MGLCEQFHLEAPWYKEMQESREYGLKFMGTLLKFTQLLRET